MEQNYMKLRENKSESVMQHSFSLEQAHIQGSVVRFKAKNVTALTKYSMSKTYKEGSIKKNNTKNNNTQKTRRRVLQERVRISFLIQNIVYIAAASHIKQVFLSYNVILHSHKLL